MYPGGQGVLDSCPWLRPSAVAHPESTTEREPIMDANQAALMRDGLLGKLENEHKATIAMIEHLPEDKLTYTPSDKLRSFADLTFHIYNVGVWFTDTMVKGEADFSDGGDKPETPGTKTALIEACQKLNQQVAKTAADVSPDALTKDVPFGDFGTFPAVSYLDWHISHLIHHRGQLSVYLRMMGAKVPATYGDSLDYPLNM